MKLPLPCFKKYSILCILLTFALFFSEQNYAQTVVVNPPNPWVVPAGVTSVKVEVWGAGGGGGGSQNTFLTNRFGGGGGGGGYSVATLPVVAGQSYTRTIGTGGTAGSNANGGNGGSSSFSGPGGTVTAGGGIGGARSTAATGGAGGTGNTFDGGNGGTGTSNGAGGGGGAGNAGDGANGANTGTAAGGIGIPNAAPYRGGNGGAAVTGANNNGNAGATPAGGGSGGKSNTSTSSGGVGGAGQIVLTFTAPTYKSQFISMNTGAATWCAGETRTVTVTVKNIGTATWTDGPGGSPDLNVGVKWNTDVSFTPDSWADYHVRTDVGSVAPGATATYSFTITASNHNGTGYTTPLSAGTNNLTFDLVYEGVSWFGDNNGLVGPGNTKFVSPAINISALPQGVFSGNAICTNGGTGQLTFTASAGTGPFTVIYNDGVANRTQTNVSSGTAFNAFSNPGTTTNYNLVSVTSAAGCVSTGGFTDGSATITMNSAPSISVQPTSQTRCVGQSVSFSVTANGTAPSYQWRKGTTNISGANSATYTIPAVALADAGSYNVVVSVNGCASIISAPAPLVVNARPTANITSASTPLCGGSSTNITGTVAATGAWTVTLSSGHTASGNGNGNFSISVNPTVATTYTIASLSDINCTAVAGGLTGSTSLSIQPVPVSVSASPASTTVCSGTAVTLTGTASPSGSSPLTIDDFNGAPTFTVTGSSVGNRSQVWQQEISGANVNSVATFTSPGGGNLMVSTAGSSNIIGASSVNSLLTSGIINTTGFSSLSNLTFSHTYKDGGTSGQGLVEVSTDGGGSWSTLLTVNGNVGGSTSFATQNINFAAYVNMTNIRIRFNFVTANQNLLSNTTSWWAIDDVVLNGVRLPLYSWSANTIAAVNGLPVGAGTPSLTNNSINVHPTSTTTYTLIATNPATGCQATAAPVVVNVLAAPSFIGLADQELLTAEDLEGDCIRVYNWTHPEVNTSCPTVLSVAYTAGFPAPSSLPAGGVVVPGSAASGSFYPGVTIVTYSATDVNNNVVTGSFTITVYDNEVPLLTCPPDITVNSDLDACGATVDIGWPEATDNCTLDFITNNYPSNFFPLGTTEVTWTAFDNNGNSNSCIQLITVTDNQFPTIVCPANVSVNNSPGSCGATITLATPQTIDNCGVTQPANDHPSTTFPVGTTPVEWSVTDISGNTSTCIQLVTVTDNEPPAITCPAPVTTVTDPASAVATVALVQPTVTDNCAVLSIVNDHPAMTFPIGVTIVTWTVTDVNGNTNTCKQTILVNDIIDPEIICNPPIAIDNRKASCEGVTDVTYPYASDNSGHVTVTADYAGLPTPSIDPVTPLMVNGVVFPVGLTTIVWTVTDPSDNTSWCTQSVTVTDSELPTITCPAEVNQANDPGACSAVINLAVPATSDNCGVLSVSTDYPSNIFPVGITIVTWTVTDVNGNTNSCTQTITISDQQLPTIANPSALSVNTDNGQCTASISLAPPATQDNCAVATVLSSHPSTVYPEGTTLVTWTVTDIHGNSNSVVQTVTVVDNELPKITAGAAITQTADAGVCGALITVVNATAVDNCGVGAPVGTRNDGLGLNALYPVGVTTITWNVTDIHGNIAIPVTQTVTVTDNELPVITAAGDLTINNDESLCSASPVIVPATATDNCGVGDPVGSRSDGLSLTAPYPVGITTITWVVSDIHGNAAVQVAQNVTVTDNELPVISAATNANVSSDPGICAAIVSIDPLTATDNCGVGQVNGTRNDGLALTAEYPVGVTTITWTVTDIHGNNAVDVIQVITVTDNEIPVITAGADITQTADAGKCGAIVPVTAATATDNCGVAAPAGTRSDALELTAPYPVGLTTITWTASDIHGNAAVAVVQNITITDNELPVISAGDNIDQTADEGVCGALVTVIGAVATDNCGTVAPTGTRSDNLPLDAAYPVGVTSITWNVTDIHGNAATAVTQTITVIDYESPTFSAPADLTIFTTENCSYEAGTAVTGDVTNEHDNCTTVLQATFTDEIINGSCEGTRIISRTWHLEDNNGNAATDQVQTITILDNTAPAFTRPADIEIFTGDGCAYDASVAVTGDVTDESDNCSTGLQATYTDVVSNGSCTGAKIITRTWHLSDHCGNAAEEQVQIITVSDNTAPVISTCAPSVAVVPNNTGCTSTLLDYRSSVVATDNCSNVTLTQSPAAGTALPLGLNPVVITATDACGNSSSCSFTVTVNNTLDFALTNSNPQLYYGYALDQSTAIKGIPTGGTAPYKIVITMNRPLGCNVVNSTGDEKWVATGGTSVGNTCPTSGSGSIPVSTIMNVAAGGSYSVTATLMANAVVTVTVTDANGCVVTKTTNVYSEDARCFAGASGNTKIRICHRTGNANDPCHELCVSESALAAHLAHGDFLGTCTPNCEAPAVFSIVSNAGSGGSISPNGNTVLNAGGNQAYTITADNCFSIADVVVDGVSQGAIGTYTFTNVQANHTISATFAINTTLLAPVVTGPVNVCQYVNTGEPVTYSFNSAGATSYSYVLPPNVTLVGSTTNSITLNFLTGFDVQANKQIRVTALSACGNSPMTIYYLAAQKPITPQPITASSSNVCAVIGTPGTISYTINAVAGATSYSWTSPAGTTIAHPNGPGISDTTVTLSFSNSFTSSAITVQAANGCGTNSARSLMITRSNPPIPGLINGPTNACPHMAPGGVAATYSVPPVAVASSYNWTTPPGTIVTHPNGAGPDDHTITVLYPAGFTTGTISVSVSNGCGTSGQRSLSIGKLNPATPGVIDVIQVGFCGDATAVAGSSRVYSYTIASIPANASSVHWTIPVGAILESGQATTSITVRYPDAAVNGLVTVQAVSNCAVSTVRSSTVKLPACPPPAFTRTQAANGNIHPKVVIPVATAMEAMEVKVFPNPTATDFKVQVITAGKETIKVRLLDIEGREFRTLTALPYQTINIGSDLTAGSYILEVGKGKEVKTTKLLKF